MPYYVIADATESEGSRELRLIAYELDGSTYKRVKLDGRGRAWLEAVGLWLGVKKSPTTGGDRLVLIDPATDEEIGDYTAVNQARAAESERADAEARAARRNRSEPTPRPAPARRSRSEPTPKPAPVPMPRRVSANSRRS